MAELRKIRFYLDEAVSLRLSNILQSHPYSDIFAFRWKKIRNLQNNIFSTEINRNKIFITTNSDYLDEDKYPINTLENTVIIVIQIEESSDSFNNIGYVLFNFLEFSITSLIYQSKVCINEDITIYAYSSGSIKIMKYDLIQFAKKEYIFKTKSSDKDLYSIQKILIKKGQTNKSLTYDDLYNEFPPDIVTADIISETVEHLKTYNIKVFDTCNEHNQDEPQKSQDNDQFFRNNAEILEEVSKLRTIDSVKNRLVGLAGKERFLTISDINEALIDDLNVEELDDLISSLIEMDITVGDDPIEKKFKASNKKRDIRLQGLLHHTIENNKNDKNILVNSHLNLVRDIINEYRNSKSLTMAYNDLMQEGYLALLLAATDYKPDGKDSFSTFASKRIKVFIENTIKNEQTQNPFQDNISDFVYSDKEQGYTKSWRKEQSQDPYEQTQNPFRDSIPSFTYSDKEHGYIKYWRDEEDIYTAEISNQSNSVNKDKSEITITSISKIQLPQIPNFEKVNPTVTSDNASLLVEKRNIDNNKNPRNNRPEYRHATFTESLFIQSEEDASDATSESLPKVYSKVRFDNDRRLSLYAKVVGERAEKIVLKYLADTLTASERDSIKWISKSGETPGWDIEYCDSDNNMVAIEVKGTNGKNFPNVEITGNEWNAAIELRDQFWIYLVSDCLGTSPKIQRLQNPFKLKEMGLLRTTPILWRIEMISSDDITK